MATGHETSGRWEQSGHVGFSRVPLKVPWSPSVPCPLHKSARRHSPVGRQLEPPRFHHWDSGEPLLLGPQSIPKVSPKRDGRFTGNSMARALVQREHPPSVLGTAAGSLRCHHPVGRGCAPVGSPAPRFEHPAPWLLLPAPTPTGGVAASALARGGKWISRAP